MENIYKHNGIATRAASLLGINREDMARQVKHPRDHRLWVHCEESNVSVGIGRIKMQYRENQWHVRVDGPDMWDRQFLVVGKLCKPTDVVKFNDPQGREIHTCMVKDLDREGYVKTSPKNTRRKAEVRHITEATSMDRFYNL